MAFPNPQPPMSRSIFTVGHRLNDALTEAETRIERVAAFLAGSKPAEVDNRKSDGRIPPALDQLDALALRLETLASRIGDVEEMNLGSRGMSENAATGRAGL